MGSPETTHARPLYTTDLDDGWRETTSNLEAATNPFAGGVGARPAEAPGYAADGLAAAAHSGDMAEHAEPAAVSVTADSGPMVQLAMESRTARLPFTDWSLPEPGEATMAPELGYDPRLYLRDTFCPRSHKTVLGIGDYKPRPADVGQAPIRSTSATTLGLGAPPALQVEPPEPCAPENGRSSTAPPSPRTARATAAVLVLGIVATAEYGLLTRPTTTLLPAASGTTSAGRLSTQHPVRGVGVARLHAAASGSSRAAMAVPDDSVTIARTALAFEWQARTIEIRATPAEARVYRETKSIGKTPLEIRWVPGRTINLVVAAEGYRPQNLTLDGSQTRVSIDLIADPPTNGKSSMPRVDDD